MWLGLSLFYVGAVLCLNGLWMLGRIADREIWVINVFAGLVSLIIGLASAFGPEPDAASVKTGALTLLFAFTYLWVAINRFTGPMAGAWAGSASSWRSRPCRWPSIR